MLLTIEQRLQHLEARLKEIALWLVREHAELSEWSFDGSPLTRGASWPTLEGVRTMTHPLCRLPDGWPLEEARLDLALGGEGLLRIRYEDGRDERYGLDPFHHLFKLSGHAFQLEVEAVARLPLGVPNRSARLERARLVWIDEALVVFERRLTLVAETLRAAGAADVVEPLLAIAEEAIIGLEWPSRTEPYVSRTAPAEFMQQIWKLPEGIEEHPPGLDDAARASIHSAAERLDRDIASLRELHPPRGAVHLSGHAHLDLAWLWPLEETRRKARRTFHTVTQLLERYPELTFNQSSAQFYAFIEEDDPELFDVIRRRVDEGRWEALGGMWVEPDLNMPCGESIARQLLYGQRYFRFAFGRTSSVCWLPDCFGFTPGLPQLLSLAGINSFFTHKMNWSESNPFPYDLFWWEGLDGTKVLAHGFNNPDMGYNGRLGPLALTGTWRNFRGKQFHPETLLTIGYGDGAGGPTAEMLERHRELKSFPALPSAHFGRVDDYYEETRSELGDARLPEWSGELYLEFHRGTLTSQGRIKRLHRLAERNLVAAESVAALRALVGGPAPENLEGRWRILLRNEFHDILPGSSVLEVNKTAEKELLEVSNDAAERLDAQLHALVHEKVAGGDEDGVLVVNPDASIRPLRLELPPGVAGAQEVEGGGVVATKDSIAPLSIAVAVDLRAQTGLESGDDRLENELVRVGFGDDGTIASVFDKRAGREALAGRGNQLWAFVDKPRAWDAWDLDAAYALDGEEIVALESFEVIERGPHRAALRIVRSFRNSRITQDVRLWANSRRLDFKTTLEWNDRHFLLKCRWPLAVRARVASFETAFGIVQRPTHRNTSWDQAQFEVPAHRFADLSEPGYGVALLNDGRYGHHALNNELGLSLLRSPAYPDPLADEGRHDFTYALLPHEGGLIDGGVLAEAEDLNRPLPAIPVRAAGAATWQPVRLEGVALGLGALKRQEDAEGLVLRVYEPQGARGPLTVQLPEGWKVTAEVDLLEEPIGPPPDRMGPFQVRTLLLEQNPPSGRQTPPESI